jgi:hypothetical protein
VFSLFAKPNKCLLRVLEYFRH